MLKGIYRGQAGISAEKHHFTGISSSPADSMTDLLKGVFRDTPGPRPLPTPNEEADSYFTQSHVPPNHQHPEYDGVTEQDFPQGPRRDIMRAPSTCSTEGRQSYQPAQELTTTGNKTIKITLEDTNAPVSKAKVPDPHPQAKLDRFWNVFEPEFLGKVTRMLPTPLIQSTPATSKQAGDRAHKSHESYNDAKARCIRDVKRIIRECRAHNKKYTDTHFDIERDLKITRRRDCLDGLYNTTTSGSDNKERAHPTDVKRVCEIFENPTFFASSASFDDIIQGNLGDCWLLAAFSILTCNGQLVRDICVIQDADVGVYGFVFYRDGDWHQCIIDDKLYLRAPSYDESGDVVLGMYGVQQRDQERSYNDLFQKGSKSLYFAQCRDENETWVPLLEKALAKAHGSYAALQGGQTGEAIEDLTGGVTTEIYTTNILNRDKFWHDELCRIGRDFVFSAAAAAYREWRAPHSSSVRVERRQGIVSSHAYAILDTYEGHGQRLVKMRNPWGSSEWTGPWSDGSKEWNSEWFQRLNHKFGDDGIFWISYEDVLRKYKYLDRTRIFGPEWHVAQQWTSVQVPWNTTDYQQTRFRIEVPGDTEAVIVLSQLDDRYWQGLQGKYNYTLQFRIQKDDEGEDDDYLARSPMTYELVRSNIVEVPLEKGKYTVLFKVEARKTNRRDVEAVIRENIWRKEKLMQVGTLYDLAHQKGQRSTTEKPSPPEPVPADSTEKKDEKPDADEKNKDPNRDPWNAFCVVGLRVYSKQPSMGLKVIHPDEDEEIAPPTLDRDDIGKAPLEEAQHNSEQTPDGTPVVTPDESVVDSEEKPANAQIAAATFSEDKPAPALTPSEEQIATVAIVVDVKAPDRPKPADTTTEASKAPDTTMEISQIMDDLAGDKDVSRT